MKKQWRYRDRLHCYIDPIWTIYTKIAAISCIINYAKFCDHTLLIEKTFLQGLDIDRSVCMVAINSSCPIWTICSKVLAITWIIIHVTFGKISCQIKKFSIQKLEFNRTVCMTATCYSYSLWAVPTNRHLCRKKRTCAKFLIDISKTG